MRWDEFTVLLLDKWVRFAARDSRQVEFDTPVPGSMSVVDHGHRFEWLVQYVLQNRDMEEAKAKRFIRGLRPEISRYLVTLGIMTFDDVAQKAPLIEREELQAKLAPSRPQMSGKG